MSYLKQTSEVAGKYVPVIENQNGKIIDGFHRLDVDPNWKPEFTVKDGRLVFDLDPIHTIAARLIINTQRRNPEREDYNQLAAALQESESGAKRWLTKSGLTISQRMEQITGIPQDTIQGYLDTRFKGLPRYPGEPGDLGTGKQIRIPEAIASDVEAMAKEVRKAVNQSPSIKRDLIGTAKKRLKGVATEVSEASNLPSDLKRLVAKGQLPLDVAQFLLRNVPKRFVMNEVETAVKEHMDLSDAEVHVLTQRPFYTAHQKEETKDTKQEKKENVGPVYGTSLSYLNLKSQEVESLRSDQIWYRDGKGKETTLEAQIEALHSELKVGDKISVQVTVIQLVPKGVVAEHRKKLAQK